MRRKESLAFVLASVAAGAPQRADAQAAAPASLPGWSLASSVGGGWQSNPSFQAAGESSVAGVGRASVVRTWTRPRASLVASLNASGALYRAEVSQNRYEYGGTLAGTTSIGSRTTMSYGVAGRTLYGDVEGVDTEGLLLPITRSTNASANVSFETQTSARTRLFLAGRYTRYSFDAAQLVDGESASGNARYSIQVSERDSVDVGYGFQANMYEGDTQASRIHTVFGGYQRTLSQRVTATLNGGANARVTPPAGISDAIWSLYADATVSGRFEKSNLQARYREGMTVAPGLGRDRRIRQFGASYGTALGRRVTFSLSGSHTRNSDPTDETVAYTTDSASAGLRATLGGAFGISLLQEYRRRGETLQAEPLSDYRVMLTFDMARTFQ